MFEEEDEKEEGDFNDSIDEEEEDEQVVMQHYPHAMGMGFLTYVPHFFYCAVGL